MSFDCCDNPQPRISDLDGRFFCASCKTWLSVDIEKGDDLAPDSTGAEDVGDHERENS